MTMKAEVTRGARTRLRPATRNRLLSIALASGLWATGVVLFPDPQQRAPWLYGLVLTLGYGHLLGAALGAKLAAPEAQVIAAMGDGSYMFGVPIAAHFVSRAHNLPVLNMVSDDYWMQSLDFGITWWF